MSKTSKILTVIIIFLLALTFGLFYNKVSVTSFLTDSGFDSSYDSGGSSWDSGGSSWDSGGSSWDSGSSHSSYGGSGSSSSEGSFGGAVILIIIIVVVLLAASSKGSNGNNNNNNSYRSTRPLELAKYKALSEARFSEVIKDIKLEDFMFERISDLIQVQYNWMTFNYDKLREKLTDELYNQYEMQLKTLEMKGQKNVMTNFKSIDSMVTDVKNVNGRYEVTMELIISFIDYIEQNGAPVRGSSTNPITMHYELMFISSSNGIVDKCPKCGAELKDTTTQICPYCKTQITQNSTKWVMSKKIAKPEPNTMLYGVLLKL